MESFCYRPDPEADDGCDAAICGVLEIYIHHARNIHNICIYANQDVYAKFSLTCSPDDAISTRVVSGGGKNPNFDERLQLQIPSRDAAVLKCEIWMMSGARNYLDDQLLGFALVPISSLAAAGGGRLTQDFTLSSTDLFHSPAGTVKLSLSLDAAGGFQSATATSSSISSDVVILDPAEYGTIEIPDYNLVKENQEMVSEYLSTAASAGEATIPFFHLVASSQDCEMVANSRDSPDGSIQSSAPFTVSTTTSISEDSISKKIISSSNVVSPGTPTSRTERGSKISAKEGEDGAGSGRNSGICDNGELGSVFKSPMGNINKLEEEQSEMQKQIVDMYMRSMQQFTESLAKMKLPMDVDSPKTLGSGDVIHDQGGGINKTESEKKKDGSRVFYGSRAFF
ncbi:hypothetical protein AXF42_Ash009201 [Apostasia shenzhenica]|uniref:C2 domain-containing protein n=1 Tax=Apostasia shenzhenica TaxID=1088818 RepID=A0A2I0ADX1_9ASPA|nr:hypothetical protein AXF42_Ash009201 [Apostasia shenzhenica]